MKVHLQNPIFRVTPSLRTLCIYLVLALSLVGCGENPSTTDIQPQKAPTSDNHPIEGTSKVKQSRTAVDELCSQASQDSNHRLTTLTKAQRVKLMCDVKTTLLERYSLLDYKEEKVLGTKASVLLDDCILQENQIENRSFENSFFEDRARACLSQFQDTHLNISRVTSSPFLSLGIQAQEIAGKLYISSVSQAATFGFKNGRLKPGMEIRRINGRSTESSLSQLIPFIEGSSKAYVRKEATRSLFYRNFFYPRSKTVRLEIEGLNEPINLKWRLLEQARQKDTIAYLQKIGIDPTPVKSFSETPSNLETPVFPKDQSGAPLKTYSTDTGEVGLNLGKVRFANKSACYIQLLTFNTDNWFSKKNSKLEFHEPIQNFVSSCERDQTPLILDLRSNSGGRISKLPAQLLAILSKRQTPRVAAFVGARFNEHLARVQTQLPSNTTNPRLEALKAASQEDLAYIPPQIESASHFAQSRPSSFEQKIVTLITPHCISACDLLAGLLKKSDRSLFIGQPTNGAGGRLAQFTPATSVVDFEWIDPMGFLKLQIPTGFTGVSSSSNETSLATNDYTAYKSLILEHKPTLPSHGLNYRSSLSDLLQKNIGWRHKAMQSLFPELSARNPDSSSEKTSELRTVISSPGT